MNPVMKPAMKPLIEGGIYAITSHEHSLGRGNLEIYFESGQLDETVALLQKNGVEFIHPLVEQPWGQRVVRFYDPDRHIVEVGEPMPVVIVRYLSQGLSVDEVVQRTFMPREIVEQIAASVK